MMSIQLYFKVASWCVNLPYRHDGVPVLAVARPDGDFVTFGPDVDHGSAHILACLIERLTD